MFFRPGGSDPGRDGCRVPLPWGGDEPPFGFSPDGISALPWLPQPAVWKVYSAAAQQGDSSSMLELYRAALHRRRAEPELGDGSLRWLDSPEDVLAFARGERFVCVVNISHRAVELPAHESVLLVSGALDDGQLPPDTAIWLRVGQGAIVAATTSDGSRSRSRPLGVARAGTRQQPRLLQQDPVSP